MTSRNRESGTALVELSMVLPLFLLLLFGVMDFGWYFAQQVEVRNAAREGARLAVVDYDDTSTMRGLVCSRATLSGPRASVQFELLTVSPTADEPDTARVVVNQTYQSITGGFIPGLQGRTIASTVEMRLEQSIETWSTDGSLQGCDS